MKPIHILLISLVIMLVSCKTLDNNQVEENNNPPEHKQDIPFDFLGFTYSVNEENSIMSDSGLYNVTYNCKLTFQNKNNNFKVDLIIKDSSEKTLLEKNEITPALLDKKTGTYIIEEQFDNVLSYRSLYYEIKVNHKTESEVFDGTVVNEDMPFIEDYSLGPIISRALNGKKEVSLSVGMDVTNCASVEWIRLIPPSYDSFWNIPWKHADNKIHATGLIYDENRTKIQNGNYLLQLNFGTFGIIEKEVPIIDMFNNTKSSNYGLPVAVLKNEEKNTLNLEINLLEKIDYMELFIYSTIDEELQKIGTARYKTPIENVAKKSLKDSVYDDFGNMVKIKNNKEYHFQVYLYSHEFNNIKYISISKIYPFKIKGFPFLPF